MVLEEIMDNGLVMRNVRNEDNRVALLQKGRLLFKGGSYTIEVRYI